MWVNRFSASSISTLVAAHADDGLVEVDVDLGIFVELGAQLAVLEGREHRAAARRSPRRWRAR